MQLFFNNYLHIEQNIFGRYEIIFRSFQNALSNHQKKSNLLFGIENREKFRLRREDAAKISRPDRVTQTWTAESSQKNFEGKKLLKQKKECGHR